MIKQFLETNLLDKHKELLKWNSKVTQNFLNALDNSVINNSFTIGLPYWSKQDPVLVKEFTWLMSKLGYGTTEIKRNYSKFIFNMTILDKELITKYRKNCKSIDMLMRKDTDTYSTTLVKRNGTIYDDGLQRPGMAMAAKRVFKLDTDKLAEYRRPILQNLIKSIKRGIELGHISDKFFADEVSYLDMANYALDYYSNPDREYNSEYNVQDQRGRAIKGILKRVGNYISSKDIRALLVVPHTDSVVITKDSTDALNDIYYFIAELTGNKCLGGTEADKIAAGKHAYKTRELPRLDLKSEEERKDLHELIWLERIYNKLDRLNTIGIVTWNIPLEIDHSMSLAQIVGALTNDKRVLESTGVIGDKLSDPWHVEGVRRLVAKAVGTPVFYGSSASAVALVKLKKIDIDKQELGKLKLEFTKGRFAILKQFKDLLIQNYSVHKPIIDIDTGISKFQIHVNKFKTVGAKTVVTEAFDGRKFKYSFTKEPNLVPDYKRMKLFWATCLVHHLDSDLIDHNLVIHQDKWALDIHDANLVLPGHAGMFRETAAKRLKFYNERRFMIISKYRQSIGAISTKADVQYMKLMKSVVDAGDVEFKRTLMK